MGGEARMVMPPLSFVKVNGSLVKLEDYLVIKFPKVFHVIKRSAQGKRPVLAEEYINSKTILLMKRNKAISDLKLPLLLEHQEEWVHPVQKKIRFPVLHYRELPL